MDIQFTHWKRTHKLGIGLVSSLFAPVILVALIWGWNVPIGEIRSKWGLFALYAMEIVGPSILTIRLLQALDKERSKKFSEAT